MPPYSGSQAVAGLGTIIEMQITHGSPVVTEFVEVGEALNISWPGQKADTIDVTNMQSERVREFIAGLVDPGEITFELNYLPTDAVQEALQTARDNGTLESFKLISPGAVETNAFKALVTQFSKDYKIDKQVMGSVTLKVSGKATKTLA